MELHVTLDGGRDLSGQIYRQLRSAILSRRLSSGDKLPPTRALAETLGVSRKTVTEAYDLLMSEGFLVGRVGDGTYIAEVIPPRRAEGSAHSSPLAPLAHWDRVLLPFNLLERGTLPYDFRVGMPDVTWFPFALWRRLLAREARVIGKRPALCADPREPPADPRGHPGLRSAIAKYIAFTRAVACDADSLLVTNGAQQAFELLARILIVPEMVVAVEEPGYPLARACFASHGATVVGVPVDGEGIQVDRIPASSRLVYVTPSHQFPLGMPMALGRRLELLAWAHAHQALIIEDDYDGEFRFEGRSLESLQNLDRRGVVAYVGTFSKTLFPSLRLGFVVAPVALREALVKAHWLSDWHSHTLAQAALAQFIQGGHLAKHIRRMRRIYDARRRLLLATLHRDFHPWFEPIAVAAGIHLAVRLKQPLDLDSLIAEARAQGVGVYPMARFATQPERQPGLVFGFGALGEDAIKAGLGRLKALLDRERT